MSSPSRRGVIVDDDGKLLGTVKPFEVLSAIEEAERPEVDLADLSADDVGANGKGAAPDKDAG